MDHALWLAGILIPLSGMNWPLAVRAWSNHWTTRQVTDCLFGIKPPWTFSQKSLCEPHMFTGSLEEPRSNTLLLFPLIDDQTEAQRGQISSPQPQKTVKAEIKIWALVYTSNCRIFQFLFPHCGIFPSQLIEDISLETNGSSYSMTVVHNSFSSSTVGDIIDNDGSES